MALRVRSAYALRAAARASAVALASDALVEAGGSRPREADRPRAASGLPPTASRLARAPPPPPPPLVVVVEDRAEEAAEDERGSEAERRGTAVVEVAPAAFPCRCDTTAPPRALSVGRLVIMGGLPAGLAGAGGGSSLSAGCLSERFKLKDPLGPGFSESVPEATEVDSAGGAAGVLARGSAGGPADGTVAGAFAFLRNIGTKCALGLRNTSSEFVDCCQSRTYTATLYETKIINF